MRIAVPSRRRGERGYVLLSLLLGASLLVIAAAAVAPRIALEIRRDQEAELIHRGAQYRRAIRRFAKQTGRYPVTLQDLDDTNGVRFLRRHYKDPITGKDFNILRMSATPAAMGTSLSASSLQAANGDRSTGGQQSSDSDASEGSSGQSSDAAIPIQPHSEFAAAENHALQSSPAEVPTPANSIGYGLMIGVVSTSKARTIREFNQKDRYNQWYFFYDPSFDRGFEVNGPTPLVRPPANLQGPASSASPVQPGTAIQQPAPSVPQ